MGTKVHSKVYNPGHYQMMDLNNSVVNGMLALYHEDKTLKNGRFCNLSSSSSAVDTYIGQEKEKMRQIILKHDSVVGNQIQELHRLYRRQRDLMNELERREFGKRPLPSDTPKASLFLSQTPCEDAKNTHNISDIPLAGLSYGRIPASDTGVIQPHLSFIQGKSTCNTFPSHGVQLKDDYLESKCNNFQRKGFDLEMPAEVYTYNEEKQQGEKICGVAGTESYLLGRNGDTNLCTGSGLDSNCNGDSLRSKVFISSAHNLADLNKPIWDEVTPIANSVSSVDGSTRLRGDMQKREIFVNSISGSRFWPQDFLQRGTGEKYRNIELNHKDSKIDKSANGKTRYDDHASLDGISDNHAPTLIRSLQFEPKKAKETIILALSDHGSLAPQKSRTNFAVSISDRNHIRAADTSYTSSLHPCNQQSAGVKSKPSTTLNTLSQTVASFQTNPCLHTLVPITEKPSNSRIHFNREEMHSSNNLRSPSSRSEVSHQDALCNGFQSDVKKLHACLDLNSYPHPQQHSAYADSESAHCSGEQTKAKEVIYQMSMDALRNHSKHFFNKVAMTNGPFINLASPTYGFECGSKKVVDNVSLSSTKSMGFPIVNAPQISKDLSSSISPSKPTHCASNLDTSGASADHDAKSVCQVQVMDSVAENGLRNSVSGLRHQIDLNLSLSDEEAPSPPCLPQAVMKIATTEINLEAPGVLESNSAVPADEADHSEKINGIGSKELLDDTREHNEELIRVAAEAIVDISLSQMEVADPSCQLQEASSADCLLWLADVILSSEVSANDSKDTKCLSNGDDACDDKTNPEGMDEFEILTLKLEELKEQECLWKPCNSEHLNDEQILGTPVPQQTRKGQARRGRQRKDFQNVLPGLVTLSRYEILEDLQVIEDMVKACGYPWRSSHSQRGAAKNGRRRRRSGGFTPPQTTSAVCVPKVQQPTYRQLELHDKSLAGWGKRTKRLPRQRCSTGTHTPVLECRFAN